MAHIYLASPHMSAEGYEQEYIKEAFDTNWIAPLGKNVNEFEKELAAYVGAKDAAALSAGTAAIHLALKAAGVKEGGCGLLSGSDLFRPRPIPSSMKRQFRCSSTVITGPGICPRMRWSAHLKHIPE